jgi:dCTP deaminase
MIKNDSWIRQQAEAGMIRPFAGSNVREVVWDIPATEASDGMGTLAGMGHRKVISYGTSSYGYDLRLSETEFMVFQHIPGTVVDPKRFNPANLVPVQLHSDELGSYFILPAHSYGLGVALERLNVPPNVTVICVGKSTYARCGVIVNVTPAEAGWAGHLTLEFSNSAPSDCRIYAEEGVCQLVFFEGDPCEVTYLDRAGKYQDQPERVTLAKV